MHCVSSRKVFQKLKKKEKFIKLVKPFKGHKTTMIFKTNIVRMINKYPKPMKSSMRSNF